MKTTEEMWRQAILLENSTIEKAIRNLDEVAIKIVLVVNKANKLIGTISDGDIRRGLIRGLDLKTPITSIIHHNPLVVPPEMSREMVMQLMVANKIHQIPVVNEQYQLVDLHLWDKMTTISKRANLMVIMAGGKGTRLLPLTQNCPKPMVLLNGKPLLEHIIDRAVLEGFNHFVLAIHHLGNII